MWVEAIVSKDDLTAFVAEVVPLCIHLDQDDASGHYIRLTDPHRIDLVPDRGIRITCKAQVRWPMLGIDIPIHIDSLTAILSAKIAGVAGEDELAFGLWLEQIDVAWVPSAFDESITEKINDELSRRSSDLRWKFGDSLSHVFALPASLQPLRALALRVAWGKVRFGEDALAMVVSYHLHARNHEALALPPGSATKLTDGDGKEQQRPAPLWRKPRARIPPVIALAGGAALAAALAYTVVGAIGRLRRYMR